MATLFDSLNNIPDTAVVEKKGGNFVPVHPIELDANFSQVEDSKLVAKVAGRKAAIAALPQGQKASKELLGWSELPIEATDDTIKDFCNRLAEAMINNRNVATVRFEAVGNYPVLQFASSEKVATNGYCNEHGASTFEDAKLAFVAMQLLGLGTNIRPLLFKNSAGRYEFRAKLQVRTKK